MAIMLSAVLYMSSSLAVGSVYYCAPQLAYLILPILADLDLLTLTYSGFYVLI